MHVKEIILKKVNIKEENVYESENNVEILSFNVCMAERYHVVVYVLIVNKLNTRRRGEKKQKI